MGFFGPSKKNISVLGFKELRIQLSAKGFSMQELNEVEKIFRADLYESEDSQRGIDKKEFEHAISWMRSNVDSHRIPSYKLDVLEELFRERL